MTKTSITTDTMFICSHAADRSPLKESFTLSGAMLYDFTARLGALEFKEARPKESL